MKSEYTVDRLDKFVNLLPRKFFDRPGKKFVRELLAGVIISQSLVVTEIARAIAPSKSKFRAAYKRLLRRLGEVDLLPMKEQQQARAFRSVTDNSIIAIDLGDITKPCSEQLEALAWVADGSDDHKIKKGYGLLGAVSVDPTQQDKTPEPLELRLYSTESEEWSSENTLLMDFISTIHARAHGKGTHVIDRGGDRGILLKHYFELNQSFIIRLKDRCLTDVDRDVTFQISKQTIHRDNLPYSVSIRREANEGNEKRSTMHLRFDFCRVKVTNLKKKVPHQCWLVTAWGLNSKKPMFLLTNRPIATVDDAVNAIIGYLSRWSVEETYRFTKLGLGMESMRCFSFAKLQNLIHAIFAATSLMARMAKHMSWQTLFARIALRLKPAPDRLYNWIYRAADALQLLFAKHLSLLLAANAPNPVRRKPRGLTQLCLFSPEIEV